MKDSFASGLFDYSVARGPGNLVPPCGRVLKGRPESALEVDCFAQMSYLSKSASQLLNPIRTPTFDAYFVPAQQSLYHLARRRGTGRPPDSISKASIIIPELEGGGPSQLSHCDQVAGLISELACFLKGDYAGSRFPNRLFKQFSLPFFGHEPFQMRCRGTLLDRDLDFIIYY